jgi:hypothetical protein
MYKYKYKYKYGLMDPRTSRDADSSLYEKNPFIAQGMTTFYKEKDKGGAPLYVGTGVSIPDLTKIGDPTGNWNDAIVSVLVGRGNKVTLYEHINYKGLSVLLDIPGMVYNLDGIILGNRCEKYRNKLPPSDCITKMTWAKKASSLKVEPS